MVLSRRWWSILGIMVIVALVGCAPSFVLAPAGQDQQAKAFTPSIGKAAIYVYRASRGDLQPLVNIDGRDIGYIAKGAFFWIEVDPGEHDVWVGLDKFRVSRLENLKQTLVSINALSGQSYFVRVDKFTKHEAVNAETAKAELLDCCMLVAQVQPTSVLFE